MMVVQIDGENFSLKRASSFFAIASRQGSWSTGGIYGNKTCLERWLPYSQSWRLPMREHQGGREAADKLLSKEARSFYKQGARLFVLAADDGGYTALVRELIQCGCTVMGIGSENAARKLRGACTDFFVATQEQQDTKSKHCIKAIGATMISPEIEHSSEEETPLAVIKRLYGSEKLPQHLVSLVGLFLEQTFQALCLTQEERMVHLPQEYLDLLDKVQQDPLLSFLWSGERKKQWETVHVFALRCHQAYQDGYQAANRSFSGFLVDPKSRLFEEQMQQDTQLVCYAQPLNAAHTYTIYDTYPAASSLKQWYQRGYRARGMELQATAEEVWAPS